MSTPRPLPCCNAIATTMDERARTAGVELATDPFLFSLAADCSKPMPPDYFTKRVGVLKGYLGIEDKRPEVVPSRMRRSVSATSPPPPRPHGRTGPLAQRRHVFREIGEQLGRSERWASLAVAAAERRDAGRSIGPRLSTSTDRSSLFGSSPLPSSSTLDSMSAWSPNGKGMVLRSSRGTTPSREHHRTNEQRSTWAALCTEATHSSTTLSTSFANTSLLHGLGKRKDAGNDGPGQYPTGRFPLVSADMTEGDGSNRIRIVPELVGTFVGTH